MSHTASAPSSGSAGWLDLLLETHDATQVWQSVFARLRDLALAARGPAALHRETILPDRLLAESAWSLWQEFPQHAPTVVDALKRFWVGASPFGTAVLILDGLSLRELPLLVTATRDRNVTPVRVEVHGSEVPPETDRFAAALGLPGRSKLFNNRPPGTFLFGGPDVHSDVLDAPFADCVGSVPANPRLFLWHKWPDEPLIHLHADKPGGPDVVADETRKQLASDGFWDFVDRLRQGRRLVITADHGYAVSKLFSGEVTDQATIKQLRDGFGASRCAAEVGERPWPRQHLPPLVCRHNGFLVVMGQRKWTVQGGFPHLCHGGLSLLEVAVPFVELPPR